jgi:hypothetical protein
VMFIQSRSFRNTSNKINKETINYLNVFGVRMRRSQPRVRQFLEGAGAAPIRA